MATLFRILKRIRFVRKPSNRLTKLILLCAVLLSAVTLLTLGISLHNAQLQADALKNQAAQLEQENDRLQDKIDILGSVDSVEQIAREELGLDYPSGIIINPGK